MESLTVRCILPLLLLCTPSLYTDVALLLDNSDRAQVIAGCLRRGLKVVAHSADKRRRRSAALTFKAMLPNLVLIAICITCWRYVGPSYSSANSYVTCGRPILPANSQAIFSAQSPVPLSSALNSQLPWENQNLRLVPTDSSASATLLSTRTVRNIL